jgi:DNA-binding MarR family transcriptional regulator
VSTDSPRPLLLADLERTVREVTALGVLFHQAIAERLGLNASDLQCLAMLGETGAVAAGELSARTGFTSGGITRIVDRLERAGLVRRQSDSTDRRRVLVAPVTERLGEIDELYRSVSLGWADLVADYDDEQLAFLLELFTRMRRLSEEQIRLVRQSANSLPHDPPPLQGGVVPE